jgi:hypothetical protein
MKEVILNITSGPYPKKYTAVVKNKKTQKTRKIHFGDSRYMQFRDTTPNRKFKQANHNSTKRRRAYFMRHSGTPFKTKAIAKEKGKSRDLYTSKILSHMFLW